MKIKTSSVMLILLLVTASIFTSCKDAQKSNLTDINQLSPDRIQALTKEAYIFSYPLIMNYATMYKQAIDESSPSYVGGFGKFKGYGFASPSDTSIVTPNNDTPYSWGWTDLRTEPWILVMPPVDSTRYYTSQWDDMWGYVVDSPGSVIDGNEGGTYMIAPLDWKGEKPEGVKRIIRTESYFAGSLTRTGASGPADLPNVKRIQSEYKLMPLHEYLNESAPKSAPSIDWPAINPGDESTIDVFKYVNFLLPYTIPNEMDKPALDSLAILGIQPGAVWDTSKFTPETKEAIKAGIGEARKELITKAATIKGGGALFNTREVLKTDYTNRALGVYIGIFGNYVWEAVYLTFPLDSQGNPLNTAKYSYKLTFKKGQTPPNKYFWSITMYNIPERFLVANPIDRYSIGSRSEHLKPNANGDIEIYISKNSPGKALENNWLPAPNGLPFFIMRVYGPAKSVQDGTYKLPPLEKVQ